MTNQAIAKRAAYEAAKHDVAQKINDLLDAALDTLSLSGEDQDQFRSDVIDLVTEEEES